MARANAIKSNALMLIFIISSCHQSSGDAGTCLKALNKNRGSRGLSRQGEIGGQLFVTHFDQANISSPEHSFALKAQDDFGGYISPNEDRRPFCNSYIEFSDNDELEGLETDVYVYTARHCVREETLLSASIKMNTTKYTPENIFKKTEYQEVPVVLNIVDIFHDAKKLIRPDLFVEFYNSFEQYRSFGSYGLSDQLKNLVAGNPDKYPHTSMMLSELTNEVGESGKYFCNLSASASAFDDDGHQKVCLLASDLAVFKGRITLDPKDKKNLREAVKYQTRKRDLFVADNPRKKNAVMDWMGYLKGLNNAAIVYAKQRTEQICGPSCINGLTSGPTSQEEAPYSTSEDNQSTNKKIIEEFDHRLLQNIEDALTQWNRISSLATDLNYILLQSNFENEEVNSPQFLSFPLAKMSLNNENPVRVEFRSYGITYESDDASIRFHPGDSGSLISLGGHIPIAVVSIVNGRKTSSGISLRTLPTRIESAALKDLLPSPRVWAPARSYSPPTRVEPSANEEDVIDASVSHDIAEERPRGYEPYPAQYPSDDSEVPTSPRLERPKIRHKSQETVARTELPAPSGGAISRDSGSTEVKSGIANIPPLPQPSEAESEGLSPDLSNNGSGC